MTRRRLSLQKKGESAAQSAQSCIFIRPNPLRGLELSTHEREKRLMDPLDVIAAPASTVLLGGMKALEANNSL
jgi:hypothetical protein